MVQTVSIVDDDDGFRASLNAILAQSGRSVRCFADGRSFLNALGHVRHGCALIDLRLPDIDGLQLLEAIRREAPGLKAIMVTGQADIPLAVAAMKRGAADFIEKPVSPPALLERLDQLLSSMDPSDSAILGKLSGLTGREREVLELLVIGHSSKQIGRVLDISPRTAEVHRRNVMQKMEAENLSHLVRMALTAGIDPKPQQER